MQYEELKVLSLNAWGLHFFAKKIQERIEHIADHLSRYDIACLQEVWSDDDYKTLANNVTSDLPHHVHFPSGVTGSGLCVFSRYPIMNVFFHEYRVTHTFRHFHNGEKFACKGVMACRIELPLGHGHVTVFNTHINYGCRDDQFVELMQFVSNVSDSMPAILCGDFNSEPNHPGIRMITSVLRMKDAFADNPSNTCDVPSNHFTKPQNSHPHGKRIDYIFYTSQQFDNTCSLELQCGQLALSGNIDGKDFPCSDHEGLEVVFKIHPPRSVYTKEILSDESLRSLDDLFNGIDQRLYAASIYHLSKKWFVLLWIGLALLSLTVSILMVQSSVYDGLAKYHLQILCTLVPSAFWIASILIAFHNLDSMHMKQGTLANHKQLKAIIEHHRKRSHRPGRSYNGTAID